MAKDLVIIIFCAAILLFFIALDIGMLISIVRSGDERRQIIVWKASAFTLMGVTGALIVEIIENLATGQEMTMNPFSHLTATAMVYFGALLFFKKGMVADMLNKIRELRKALGISQEELAKKCGVSRQTVNAIENNKYDPTLALAFRLARSCV